MTTAFIGNGPELAEDVSSLIGVISPYEMTPKQKAVSDREFAKLSLLKSPAMYTQRRAMPTDQLLLDYKKSQCERLLEHFQAGGTITSLESFNKFRITQLGRCISDLEKEGYRFNKPWKVLPSGVRVKEYSLIRVGK